MTESTILKDVLDHGPATASLTTDDAEEALLKKWSDAEEPSETAEQEDKEVDTQEDETEVATEPEETDDELEYTEVEETEDPDDEDEAETVDDDETDTSDDEDKEDGKVLSDEAVVEIKVADETHQVSVNDLKRLYGQEAAITKKSQAIASQRKEVEAQGLKYASALETLQKRAEERWKPYSDIDFYVASQKMDEKEFQALRSEAKFAHDDYKFISEEVDNFSKQIKQQQQTQLQEQAKEAIKVLTADIEGWNNSLYDKTREYAVRSGMPQDVVDVIVDPVAIKMIHKARLYDEGKKVAVKKKSKVTTKVLKKSVPQNIAKEESKRRKAQAANKKMMDAGHDFELVADALMTRWQN